jgi:hypothetical protein
MEKVHDEFEKKFILSIKMVVGIRSPCLYLQSKKIYLKIIDVNGGDDDA